MDSAVCRDFIIVPPHGERYDNPALLMRIQEELSREFSAYTFVVTIEGPLRYEDFFLIPMVGVTTSDGRMSMKAYEGHVWRGLMTTRARELFNRYVLGSLNSPELRGLPILTHVFNLNSAAGEAHILNAEMVAEVGPIHAALLAART